MEWRSDDKRTMTQSAPETGPAIGTANSCFDSGDSTPLFDKTVTPSDVGKLNRLVIPKQYAEKYFPMEVHSNDKGLILNFEDSSGKAWRFRYSYWNSSQSYVLTKGWSRFVKDKKLVAGDIVSFHRGTTEARQLYITCRYRPSDQKHPPLGQTKGALGLGLGLGLSYKSFNSATVYNPQWMHIFWPTYRPHLGPIERAVWPPQSPSRLPLHFSAPAGPEMPIAVEEPAMIKREQPLSTKKKEVRLFGVNLAGSQSLGGPMHFPS